MAGLLPFDITGTATRGYMFGNDGDLAGKVKSYLKDNEDPNAVQRLIEQGIMRREAMKLTPTSQALEQHNDETTRRYFSSNEPVAVDASLKGDLDQALRTNRMVGVLGAGRGAA